MSIDIKKLNPWHWFKHEDSNKPASLPVKREQQRFSADTFWNMHREVDRLFDAMFSNFGGWPQIAPHAYASASPFVRPRLDIKETKKDYQISVEIPGVDEKDVLLELENGALTIKGEKKNEETHEDDNYCCVERSYGSFQRTLALPPDSNEDGIEASFKSGVLTITVPREHVAKQDQEAKVISIKPAA